MTIQGRVVARAVILALAFSMVMPGAVLADEGSGRRSPKPTDSNRPASELAEPSGSQKNGGITTLAVNPYGCKGTSDNIHASGSNPGLVIGRAWSRCDYPMAKIETWSRLYKEDCVLIIFCSWNLVGLPDYQVRTNTTALQVVEAIAAANCVVGGAKYKSEGDHRFLDYGGTIWVAYTGQPSTFVLC